MSSGVVFRYGGRGAHILPLRHLRPPTLFREFTTPSSTPSGAFFRSYLLSTKFKESSPSLAAHSFSSLTAGASASCARIGFFSWYLGMIGTRPVLTKSLTAGAISVAADISSQIMTLASSGSLDLLRTLRMAGYGLLISGPSLHFWFNFVSKILPKRDFLTTFKKMALGQAIYGPLITVLFFSLNAVLQGETSAEIIARLKRDFIPTIRSGIVYWPICDFITFKFTPVWLQPLVSNLFSFLWTIYLTYMASLEKANIEKISTV